MSSLVRLLFNGGLILAASLFLCGTAAAKDTAYASYDDWWWWEGFCYAHDEWSDETPTLDARPDINYPGYTARPLPYLDCWLMEAHPEIAAAIKWRTGPSSFVAYPDWTWQQKTYLLIAVSHYWHWFEAGYPADMTDPFPIDATYGSDVPVNLAESSDVDTIISEADAWNYYIDSVALSLAAQLGHWYRWDLRWGAYVYDWDLRYLFDSDQMFAANIWKFQTDSQVYYRVISSYLHDDWPIHGAATLTSPLASLELFMRQQGLVRDSMDGTLYAALDWGRDNLVHFNGPIERANEERVWQYGGLPPVLSVIAGTVAQNNGQNFGDTEWGVQNYTMGCHGTSGFYKAVLRTVNIPVAVHNHTWHSGMSFPMWPWNVAGHITHSDALYSRAFRDQNLGLPFENPTTEPVSTSAVIIDDSEHEIWFDPALSHEQRVANVDIGLQRYLAFWQPVPTTYLMQAYCSDLANGLSHANGSVYRSVFFNQAVGLGPTGINVEALESAWYWEWLEWRRASYPGGCAAF